MSASSFRSVFMVATCAGAALGCYMVSLRVASERAALEEVETKIVLAQRDIRLLQTEIGTRGRLAQLERWNVKVMALSAPTADQFLNGGFELAKLTAPEHKSAVEAPVVLASAPATIKDVPVEPRSSAVVPAQLLHEASLKTRPAPLADELKRTQPVRAPVAVKAAPAPKSTAAAPKAQSSTSAKTPAVKAEGGPKTASAGRKSEPKAPAKVTTAPKQVRAGQRDPLAPLPEKKVKVAAAAAKPGKAPARKQ